MGVGGGGAIVTALVRCAPASAPPGDLRIGVVTTTSGPLGPTVGKATLDGTAMALQDVTKAGGWDVRGRKHNVVLVTEDDQDKQETATAAALKLINQEKVIAIIAPSISRNALPVAQAAENAKLPVISPGSTVPELTAGKRYVFRATFTDTFQGSTMARFARQDLGLSQGAVLYDVASAYNKGIADVFKQTFESAGGRIVAHETYVTGERDFGRQLGRIQAAGARFLFLPNYEYDVTAQAEQARAIGLDVPFLGADSWGGLSGAARQLLQGGFYTAHWAPDSSDERSQSFVRAYRERYGAVPRQGAPLGYDALYLLLEAIKRQGKTDPESIRSGLASISRYAGVSGTLGFGGSGDPVKSVVLLKIAGDQAVFHKQINP